MSLLSVTCHSPVFQHGQKFLVFEMYLFVADGGSGGDFQNLNRSD